MKRFVLCSVVAIFAAIPTLRAQASLASLDGTYTFVLSSLDDYAPMYNSAGQQVGFCGNGFTPIGYYCGGSISFDMITGILVSDGAGHITSGEFTVANDPNSYECNPKNNPTSPCPVVVPSNNTYSSTDSYSVGAVVDFTVGSTTNTFQAVQPSTGKPPNWTDTTDSAYICNNSNLNSCYWSQVNASLTSPNGSGGTGSITGTYTLYSNGFGRLTLKLKNSPCTGNCTETIMFGFVTSPTSSVGQTVQLSGESVLGNHNKAVGGATRMK